MPRLKIEKHAGRVSFFVPEVAYAEAEEQLLALVIKRGGASLSGDRLGIISPAMPSDLTRDVFTNSTPYD